MIPIRLLFTSSILLFLCPFVYSQVIEQLQQFKVGANENDVAHDVICMPDGGYIVAGNSNSGISGDKATLGYGADDIWVVRIDSQGNIIDEVVLGGTGNDNVSCILMLSSNRILVAGTSDSPFSGTKHAINYGSSDYWLVILNVNELSDIISQKTFGGNQDETLATVLIKDSSELIICGNSNSSTSGDKSENSLGGDDFWMVKTNLIGFDSIGGVAWENTVGGAGSDQLRDGATFSNNKYIVGGYSNSDISGDKTEPAMAFDYWVVIFDSGGNILSQHTFGGNGSDFLYHLFVDSQNKIVLSGSSYSDLSGNKDENNFTSGQLDYWVLAIDSSGAIQWQNTITADQSDFLYAETIELNDYGYLIAGESFSGNTAGGDKESLNYGASDAWIVLLDEIGDIKAQYALGGSSYEQIRTMKMDSIGSVIIAGSSSSDSSILINENSYNESNDYWIFKVQIDTSSCIINPIISPTGPISFCSGGNVTLNTPAEAGATYQWKKNGVDISGATESSYIAVTTGYYQVRVNINTCNSTSDSLSVTRLKNPTASITNIDASGTNNLCIDSSIKLKANSGAGYGYQWYKGASALVGATAQIYYASTVGNYKVKVTAPSGCNKTSSPYSIVSTCKYDVESHSYVSVYPNPNDGRFTISLTTGNEEQYSISICNVLGELILEERIISNNTNYDLSTYPKGSYFIKVTSANYFSVNEIVLQ